MKIEVILKNPSSGETKKIKVGWSWPLFLFTPFYGIPLFVKGLYREGCAALAVTVVANINSFISNKPNLVTLSLVTLAQLFFMIYFGIKGNERAGKKLLDNGWVFAQPGSDQARFAKLQWGIVDPEISQEAAA